VPILAPFRALAWRPDLRTRLDRLIAPPYDVLDEAGRAALEALHPRNIVHLDLPRAAAGGDPYFGARDRLQDWIREGTLGRDPGPSIYACEQTFHGAEGETVARRGFFARLRLEEFGGGTVLPHERTLDRPREDRRRLLLATRTHLSPVFFLHPDPGAAVARRVADACRGATWAEARTADFGLRVVRIEAPGQIEAILGPLRSQWVLIADGHHRYESALACRDERRAGGHRDAEHLLGYFCSLEDPGVRIRPIHRLVKARPGFDADAFMRALAECFEVEPVATAGALRDRMNSGPGRPGRFGFAVRGLGGFQLATWKEGAGMEAGGGAEIAAPLRRLDVVLLHRIVLESILGIGREAQARQDHLEYLKDDAEWFARAGQPATDVAIRLNPTPIDQVIEVTRAGLRLPQKSTYFHPKIPTGVVLDPFEAAAG
jgi:uncharacterized protein (DUF1015 family)